ncbi:hypothetical protein KUTeg_005722 [Tegillarca granosa]|uniref:Uncharacterized protein n=1 Tax=Tegillarca granosa TaxID=220873 RepID=A0ABQ9FHH9_TEGGR|nr:hypothetical protein KUTeg_005722 [Tegillarca granosa]
MRLTSRYEIDIAKLFTDTSKILYDHCYNDDVVAYEREEIGVFVDNRDRLKCKDSIDIVRGPDSLLFNSKEKTCSVTGVLYLQKGQIVTFNIITAKTTILMEKKSTYIGVVQL